MSRRLTCAAVLVLLVHGASVSAADAEHHAWELDAQLYGWVPGNHGTVEVDGKTAQIDVTPIDLLETVFDGDALAAGGRFAARLGRWSLIGDVFGGGAKVEIDEVVPTPFCDVSVAAKDTLRFVVADFVLAYRVGQWALPRRSRPFTLDVYAGARYVHLENELEGGVAVIGGRRFSGAASDTIDWADPIVGLEWSAPLLDTVSLGFRGDIGGFGASSDLDWGLAADVRYWLSWTPLFTRPYLLVGYRLVALDRSPGGADVDLQMRGPLAGMGFVF